MDRHEVGKICLNDNKCKVRNSTLPNKTHLSDGNFSSTSHDQFHYASQRNTCSTIAHDQIITKSNSIEVVSISETIEKEVLLGSDSTGDILYDSMKSLRLKYPKSLIFTHININSLKKEEMTPIDYFKDSFLLNGFIDILCVTETKLDETITQNDVECSPKFKFYRKDKDSNSGGICAWLRSDIPHERVQELEFEDSFHHIESLIFDFKIKKESWYFWILICNY